MNKILYSLLVMAVLLEYIWLFHQYYYAAAKFDAFRDLQYYILA